jgi:hypothetical protein
VTIYEADLKTAFRARQAHATTPACEALRANIDRIGTVHRGP